jgi:hypothetical protein
MEAYKQLFGVSGEVPNSWIYFYSGLGEESIWDDQVPISKQYLFSFFWAASTLSSSLVGDATPKSVFEIIFAIWCADLWKSIRLPASHLHGACLYSILTSIFDCKKENATSLMFAAVHLASKSSAANTCMQPARSAKNLKALLQKTSSFNYAWSVIKLAWISLVDV